MRYGALSASLAQALGWLLAALLLGHASVAFAEGDGVAVVRPDGTTVALSNERLMSLPRTIFSATSHDKTQRFEGSDLREVLRAGGIDVPELRGPLLRRVITIHAADGYVVAFALADIDASIGDMRVMLVNRQDGAALGPDQGPWRLV